MMISVALAYRAFIGVVGIWRVLKHRVGMHDEMCIE